MTSTVLLTATVRPNTELFVAQADPETRLAQYRTAIARWADLVRSSDVDLVVVETSGAQPTSLLSDVPSPLRSYVRVISYEAADTDNARGKGPFEVEAIRRGLAAISQESGDDRTVYKGTGRLVLSNAGALVQDLGSRSVRIRMTADRSFADTRFLGGTVATWHRVLLDDTDQIDELAGIYLEHVVAGSVARAAAMRSINLERLPQRPVFDGQSGSTGETYTSQYLRTPERLRRLGEDLLASIAARKQV